MQISAPFRTASLLILIFAVSHPSTAAQKAATTGQHIIVLYDLSAVLNHGAAMSQASVVVGDMLFGAEHQGLDKKLWNPGDCVSYAMTGVDDTELRTLHGPDAQFWSQWVRTVVHISEPLCTNSINEARSSFSDYVQHLGGHVRKYGLTSLAAPALFSRPPAVFARTTVLVRLSDTPAGSDEQKGLDAYPIEHYLGQNSALLDSARKAFDDTFQQQPVAIRSVAPIRIELFQIVPLTPPRVGWSQATAVAAERRWGPWQVTLPRVAISSGTCGSLLFRDAQLDIVGSEAAQSVGLRIPEALQFAPDRPNTITPFRVAPEIVSQSQANAVLHGSLECAAQGKLAMSLGILSETGNVPLKRHFKLPLVQEVTFVWIPSALVAVICVWFLWFRKPDLNVAVEFERREDDAEGLSIVEWTKGVRLLPIKVQNTKRLLLRRSKVLAQILELPNNPEAKVGFQLRNGAQVCSFGEQLNFYLARGIEPAVLSLAIDFRHTSMPERSIRPVTLKLGFNQRQHYVSFAIVPPAGGFWLGIDPGTTGACIAGGQDIHDLDTIPLEDGGVGERRFISPSLVYVCHNEQERDDKEAVHLDLDGKQVAFWAGNKVEADDTLAQSRVFRSAKRLLGYDNPHFIQCNYLGPDKIPIRGAHAVRALATYLVRSAEKHFEARASDGRKPKLKKAVVAVPNSFTPAKIEEMKECCKVGSIEKVEHIYEAEAVLMFYLWRQEHLKRDGVGPERSAEEAGNLRQNGGEFVLVCDFGGGSVNFTYARITTSEGKTSVEVLQRLGFALGGDRFDFEIAHVLWERLSKDRTYQLHDPFKMKPTAEEVELRARIWKEAELQKKKLASNRASESLRINNDEFSRAIKSDITQGDVIGASGIQEVFTQLSDGVAELVQLVQGGTSNARSGLHTLIFSGRSTRFPGVQEVISSRLGELFPGTNLVTIQLGDHAKTCVARGAAYWALQRGQIEVVRYQAFAHYGVRQSQSNRFMDFRFIPVIQSGKRFQNGFCMDEKRNLHFRHDSRLVFYQVMGADPSAILKDKKKNYSRYSILAECAINTNDEVQKIAMTLHAEDDGFEIHVFQKNQELLGQGYYRLHDIREEGDESSAWLLQ